MLGQSFLLSKSLHVVTSVLQQRGKCWKQFDKLKHSLSDSCTVNILSKNNLFDGQIFQFRLRETANAICKNKIEFIGLKAIYIHKFSYRVNQKSKIVGKMGDEFTKKTAIAYISALMHIRCKVEMRSNREIQAEC